MPGPTTDRCALKHPMTTGQNDFEIYRRRRRDIRRTPKHLTGRSFAVATDELERIGPRESLDFNGIQEPVEVDNGPDDTPESAAVAFAVECVNRESANQPDPTLNQIDRTGDHDLVVTNCSLYLRPLVIEGPIVDSEDLLIPIERVDMGDHKVFGESEIPELGYLCVDQTLGDPRKGLLVDIRDRFDIADQATNQLHVGID